MTLYHGLDEEAAMYEHARRLRQSNDHDMIRPWIRLIPPEIDTEKTEKLEA